VAGQPRHAADHNVEPNEMTTIRLARIEELDSVYSLVQQATRHMDNQGIPQWDNIYPSKAILNADIENQQMHVIEVEGRVAGLIAINEVQSPEYASVAWKHSGRALVVHRLTIHPGYQRHKLASNLMDFAEEMAATENYDCIRLDAFTRNPAAFTLYENRGYRKAGIVRFRKGEFFCFEKKISADRVINSLNTPRRRIAGKSGKR
jgi:ribosomal protein S18 acetylase RimI-like enzyme